MRAIRFGTTGGPEVLELQELPDPEPGPREVLVRVSCAGVNFIDTYHRGGMYPVPLPGGLGMEGAGTVIAAGSDVGDGGDVSIGDRVAWRNVRGSYADLVLLPVDQCLPIPDEVSDEDAAAVALQGLTAHYLCRSTYAVQPGDTVLVHAGAGGVGLLLTQMATALGATVITTVSTPEKAELSLGAGAAQAVGYDEVLETVRSLTDGVGVPVVYDGVGAATYETSLQCLRPRGLLALFGASSGPVPPFDLQRLNPLGSLFVTRPGMADYFATREERDWRTAEVYAGVADGTLTVRIGATFPLAEAAEAHRALEGRRTTGKVLLRVSG